jgi:outer membrane protein assembly factor BamB
MFDQRTSVPTEGDRNLLFASLALQLDFLEESSLGENWNAWKAQRSMPLADFLVARGRLVTEDRQAIDRLVDRKLRKHHGHVAACLADLGNGNRVRDALAERAADLPTAANETNGSVERPTSKTSAKKWYQFKPSRRSWLTHAIAACAIFSLAGLALTSFLYPAILFPAVGETVKEEELGPKLRHQLPTQGLPVSADELAASDQERAELYPAFMSQALDEWKAGNAAKAHETLHLQRPPRQESREIRGFEWYYLDRLVNAGRFELRVGEREWLGYSSDGTRLLTADVLGKVKVWEIGSGRLLREWDGNSRRLNAASFSRDGQHLVTASVNGTVSVWRAEEGGKPLVTVTHDAAAAALHPDGKLLVTGGRDGRIGVWDVKTGEAAGSFPAHQGMVTGVLFNADGRLLASVGADQTVRVWCQPFAEGRKEIRAILSPNTSPDSRLASAAFSRDGTLLAADFDDTLAIWKVDSEKPPTVLREAAHGVSSLAFSPDGTRLASATREGSVSLFDTSSGQELLRLSCGDSAGRLVFSPDGTSLAVAGPANDTVTIWEARPPAAEDLDRREATRLVDYLFTIYLRASEIEAYLQKTPWISPSIRKEALALAAKHPSDADLLNRTSWGVVKDPTHSVEDYQKAARLAEEAVRLSPTTGEYVHTLAIAQFRLGRFAQAEVTLNKAQDLTSRARRRPDLMRGPQLGPRPEYIVFRAMIHYQLGRKDEARAAMHQVRKLAPIWRAMANADAQEYIKEAEKLIGPLRISGNGQGQRDEG